MHLCSSHKTHSYSCNTVPTTPTNNQFQTTQQPTTRKQQVPAVFLAALGGYVLAAFQTQAAATKGGAEDWMCVAL